MRICFTLWGSVAAAAVLYAGGPETYTERITTVVRADPRSGKLVRSVIVTPKLVSRQTVAETVVAPRVITPGPAVEPEAAATATSTLDEAVDRIAAQNELPADLIHSVIKVESNYNPNAVSNKGALGLMQLIPATARRFGVENVFNPVQNIQGGAKYLRYLLDLYNWNYPLALAAYNAGEGAVAKYGGVPPYRETQDYLKLVNKQLVSRKPAAKPAPPATPKAETPAGPAHIQQIVQPDGTARYVNR